MLGIKRNRAIGYPITIFTYVILFFFVLFSLPEAAYAEDKEDKNNKPEVNINIDVNEGDKNKVYKDTNFNGDTEPVINIVINKDSDDEEDDGENINYINNSESAGDTNGISNSGDDQDNNIIQNNNIGGNNDTENNDDEDIEDENEDQEDIENNDNNENGDEDDNEYINNDGDESYNSNEENEDNNDNEEENPELNNEAYRYLKFFSEAISFFNEDSPGRNNVQKLNYTKFGSSLSNPGIESIRSSKKRQEPIKEMNLLAFKSLNTKKEKINQELGITVNGAGDILNLYKIIEKYRIVKVINFDEIIDMDYEKDITPDNGTKWDKSLPEFITTFWDNIKSMSSLYG